MGSTHGCSRFIPPIHRRGGTAGERNEVQGLIPPNSPDAAGGSEGRGVEPRFIPLHFLPSFRPSRLSGTLFAPHACPGALSLRACNRVHCTAAACPAPTSPRPPVYVCVRTNICTLLKEGGGGALMYVRIYVVWLQPVRRLRYHSSLGWPRNDASSVPGRSEGEKAR